MNLTEQYIISQINESLKTGEKVKSSVFRLLLSDIKNYKISTKQKDLTSDDITKIIKKMVSRYNESIETFQKGNRQDLVEKEKKELVILQKMLPAQLSTEELNAIIQNTVHEIKETGGNINFGIIMKAVINKTGSSADGKIISDLVKKFL